MAISSLPLFRSASAARRPRGAGSACVAGLLLVLFLLLADPARPGGLSPDRITARVLPSGLRLVVKEARGTDLAAVQVWIRAGGYLEEERTAGTAHLIEHLVFKGSEGRGPGLLDEEIENLGSVLEATTQKDWTRFACTVSSRYAVRIVQAMGEALRRPAFRTQDWQAEKPVLRDELAQMSQNPEAALAAILYDQAFQKHPYRRDVRGIPAGLDRVDLAAVRAFYEKYYRPANMTLVVVGNVDLESVDRAARAAFVGPPAPAPPPPLPAPERACARAVRRELPSPFRLGYIGLAFPAPAVTDQPDVYAMDLILTLLEHQGTGRLPRILRGQAGIEATYETRRQPGLLTLIAGAPGGNLESVEALMRRELETLVNRPVAAEELALARRALRGSFILDNETLAGQAGLLGYYDAIDRWQFGVEYLARVEALTPEDVQATAKKYIQLEQAVTVVLRPAAEGARPRGAVR